MSELGLSCLVQCMQIHGLLEACKRSNSLRFHAFVGAAGGEVLVFFGSAAGPLDHQAIDLVPLSQPKRHGQFGLRQITRSAFHQARSGCVSP